MELKAWTTASLNLVKYCMRGHANGLSSALQVKQCSGNSGFRSDLFVTMLLWKQNIGILIYYQGYLFSIKSCFLRHCPKQGRSWSWEIPTQVCQKYVIDSRGLSRFFFLMGTFAKTIKQKKKPLRINLFWN